MVYRRKRYLCDYGAAERVHYMAATSSGFNLYTNHASSIFNFDPPAIVLDLGKDLE